MTGYCVFLKTRHNMVYVSAFLYKTQSLDMYLVEACASGIAELRCLGKFTARLMKQRVYKNNIQNRPYKYRFKDKRGSVEIISHDQAIKIVEGDGKTVASLGKFRKFRKKNL